jgi:geranylgeranyl pyrophosphate synthase
VRDLLGRPSKQFRANLVRLSARLAGGADVPPALPALLELIHAGSLVVDDIQDDSSQRRGAACLHRLFGLPLALNTGNWLYFWPLALLDELGLAPALAAELRGRMCRAMLRCHYGQSLDLAVPVGHLPRNAVVSVVATSTRLKTGALTSLCAEVGALAGGAPPDRVEPLRRFGRRLGVGLQMLDDLGNLAGVDQDRRHEDLRLGRPTWPWAWAADDLDEQSFAALQAQARVVHARALAGLPVHSGDLAHRLRAATWHRGRRAAGVLLRRALADLEATFGASADLTAVAAEITRVEQAYV